MSMCATTGSENSRSAQWLLLGFLGLSVACAQPATEPPTTPRPAPPGAEYEAPAFTFNEIREDVYLAVQTGTLAVWSNAVIVVNSNDVLLIESHISPAAAWALLQELRQITTKPVRYVVNTHFHFDHLHGNQIYDDNVEIIGHEFTRQMVMAGRSNSGRTYEFFVQTMPAQIAELDARLQTATDAAARAELGEQLRVLRNAKVATDAVVPTPPNLTLTRRMTLHRGGREIRLLFFGRGHTGGDVVVYLPAEQLLATGDLLTAGLPYMGDGYLLEWVDTLEQLKSLEIEVILPGHGRAFGDLEKIDRLQAYLRDLWDEAASLHEQGVPAEEAAQRIDMRSHAEGFPQISDVGVDPLAVERVYDLLNDEG